MSDTFWAWAWYYVITERFERSNPRSSWSAYAAKVSASAERICPGMRFGSVDQKEALCFVEREIWCPKLTPGQLHVLEDAIAIADVLAGKSPEVREAFMNRRCAASFEEFKYGVPVLIQLGYLSKREGDIARITAAGRAAWEQSR